MYEWLVKIWDGEDLVLTENQYAFYKANYREPRVFFSDFEFSPGAVKEAIKRPAEVIRNKYPCKKCYSSGFLHGIICENCEGSGVDLPKK